jgi:hypothetical protein
VVEVTGGAVVTAVSDVTGVVAGAVTVVVGVSAIGAGPAQAIEPTSSTLAVRPRQTGRVNWVAFLTSKLARMRKNPTLPGQIWSLKDGFWQIWSVTPGTRSSLTKFAEKRS